MNAVRRRRADYAAEFAYISERDKSQRAIKVWVPGHSGHRYRVILRWSPHIVTAECQLDTPLGYKPCAGQEWVCYHALGAVVAAFREQGYMLSLGELADLKRLKNLGGFIVGIQARSSSGKLGEMIWARAQSGG